MAARVVHLINDLNANGGAERIVSELSRFCRGYLASIVVWRGGARAQERDSLTADDRVIVVNPFDLRSMKRAWKVMKEADLVHVHLFPSLYLGALLPFRKIYTEHNVWNRRRGHRWLRFFERGVYSRYDCITAVSAPVKDELAAWLSPLPASIHVVENGVDLARFQQQDGLRARTRGKRRIGMIGSFSPKKDQDTLVRALARLPENYELALAGTGERMESVRELAGRLGVASRVYFVGLVREVPAFLSGLDVYVQSSHWEGFGLAAVEAMACRLPVLASDVAGLADVVERDEHRFPVGDDGKLAELIEQMLASEEALQRATDYSISRASHFSIIKTVQSYECLYEFTRI